MAKGVMGKIGIGAVGFAAALAIGEARNPGTASETVEATVNGAVPVVQGVGVLGGETLAATGPVVAGGRDALSQSGISLSANPDAATEDTLPTTPLAG